MVIINTKVPSRRMDGGGSILYFLDIIIIGGCNTIPVIQGSSMKIKIIIIKKMKPNKQQHFIVHFDQRRSTKY